MKDQWESNLACAIVCPRCEGPLAADEHRILSVFDHQPICMNCKKEEEGKPDYPEVSQNMIGTCMSETEMQYSDPGGYCYYHFYPFSCKD
jgi:hypothetical protein